MEGQLKKPEVSVIVPTYNSAESLLQCLNSVRDQTYRPFEVVVVDGFSADSTVEIAESFGAEVFRRKSNQAEARNVGIAKSSGKYVLFLDSDQILSPSVIEECVEKCEREQVGMVRIPEIFVGKGYWSVCSAAWKNYYENIEFQYRAGAVLMHGEPRFFDKPSLRAVGALDAALTWGEDYDLLEKLRKAKIKEGFCSSVLYHQEAASLRKIFLKNLRYGKSMRLFVKQTENWIFPRLITHALLTFVEMVKGSQKASVVFGCSVLFMVKSSSMFIGALRSAEP